MLLGLTDMGYDTDTWMIDATHLKTHRTALSPALTKGGMNSKQNAGTDAAGRTVRMFLRAGQRSDYIGALTPLAELPAAEHMLADHGYDADWNREAPEGKGITPCIPSCKLLTPHDETRY